jgi:diacylglycerol O-acyltransferase
VTEQLTPLSAWFLQAEDEDPMTTMAISSTGVFEGPAPRQEDLLAHLAGRLALVPRYRQRIRAVPLDLGPPVWEDVPEVDLGWHLRRTALPAPGGPAELHRLIGRIMSARMDRARPLWEYWVVEGLEEGRWAVVQKVHHCVVDGVSGAGLYHVIFDTTPVPAPAVPDPWTPRPRTGNLTLTTRAALGLLWGPVRGMAAVGALARRPRELGVRAVKSARGVMALTGALWPAASSSLTGPMGRQRRYTSAVVSLVDVRAVRRAHGVTVNDVALAAITAAFRALLIGRGEDPHAHAVRTLVPVNIRADGEEGILDNRVSLLLPFLPVDVENPVERLHEVHRRVARAVASGEPTAGASLTAASVYEPYLPIALGIRAMMHVPQRQLVTVTTNVPGPAAPVYALGRRCVRILPYVPIADRLRTGIAIFSYGDELVFGVTADRDTVPDIEVLAAGVADEVAALAATVRA